MQNSPEQNIHVDILARLAQLEQSHARWRRIAGALMIALVLATTLGLQQATPRKITAEEVVADVIRAESFVVRTSRGEVRLDKGGLTIAQPGEATRRHNVVSHDVRIEIGIDPEWVQEGLTPTPRVLVGRIGKDTADNLVTRAAVLSPEGVHSGEWHTNNPQHNGRTDRDLIEEVRRRN